MKTALQERGQTVPSAVGQWFRLGVTTGQLRTSSPIVRNAANSRKQLQVIRMDDRVVAAALDCRGEGAQFPSYA